LPCCHTACRRQPSYGFSPDHGSGTSRRRKDFKNEAAAEMLKEMKAKWSANKGKLKECRKEVRSKGLAGDDRWFYIEDCMGRT
jgi:hypothetical protein